MKNISMTKRELANVAGYTYRRLYDIDRQLDKDKKLFVESEDGKYDLAVFVQRWVDYNVNRGSENEMSLDEVRAIHEQVKTQKTKLEVAKLEGNLVEIGEVYRLWANVVKSVTARLQGIAAKISPLLVMMESAEQIGSIIETEINGALTQIADTPVPAVEKIPESEQDGEDE